MYNSQLVQLLKVLNPRELQKFYDFVSSPYFNKSENCSQLYEALFEDAPDFTSPAIQKERLASKLYPSTQSTNSLNVDISKLTKLLEEFISLQQLGRFSTRQRNIPEQESLQDAFLNKRLLLLKFLLHRKCYNHFDRVSKQVAKLIDQVNRRGEKWYYYKSQMADLMFEYTQVQPSKSKAIKPETLIEDFEKYNVLLQLRIACEAISMESVRAFAYQRDLTYSVIALLQGKCQHYMEAPLIELYFYFWQIFDQTATANNALEKREESEQKAEQAFTVFSEKIKVHSKVVDQTELIAFYTGAINYSLKKSRKGIVVYLHHSLDLYKSMIENDLILSSNNITPRRFMNIVSIGAQCDDFVWTQQFIEDFTPHLAPALQESIHHFSTALLAFYQKEYEKVLEHLFFGEIKDVFFTINQKVLLLKTYYELSDAVGFFNQSKSFIKFLQTNKKLPPNQKKAYKNFTSISEHLIRLKHYPNAKKKEKILEKINNKAAIGKDWLLEKVAEMK